jgi:hypothetical protein
MRRFPRWVPIALLLCTRSALPQGRGGPLSAAVIAQRATPATVTIITFGASGDTLGQGSGFIVRSTGEILTNFHVMAGATRASVHLASGERFDRVQAVDSDSLADLAIIKVPGFSLPTVTMSSVVPPVGSKVVVIGSPLGLVQTVSDGLISALRMRDGKQLLQISAPISHGSSGGPVFSEAGEVVGIATLSLVEGQQLNFAVPARYALGLLAERRAPSPLATMFAGSVATLANSASQGASSRSGAVATAWIPSRADFLARPNPPASPTPRLPFGGKFWMVDSFVVTPPRGVPWGLVFVGDSYLLSDGSGVSYERRVLHDTLSDATLHMWLSDLNATSDGRLSLAAISIASLGAAPGYQTPDGAFFAAEGRVDTLTYTSRVHLQPNPSDLNVNEGIYSIQLRTTYESGSYRPTDVMEWSGEMLVVRVANGDSVVVDLFARNAQGGMTGLHGRSWQARTGTHYIVTGPDGASQVSFTLENGRVTGSWIDDRKTAVFRGTLTGSRK